MEHVIAFESLFVTAQKNVLIKKKKLNNACEWRITNMNNELRIMNTEYQ